MAKFKNRIGEILKSKWRNSENSQKIRQTKLNEIFWPFGRKSRIDPMPAGPPQRPPPGPICDTQPDAKRRNFGTQNSQIKQHFLEQLFQDICCNLFTSITHNSSSSGSQSPFWQSSLYSFRNDLFCYSTVSRACFHLVAVPCLGSSHFGNRDCRFDGVFSWVDR